MLKVGHWKDVEPEIYDSKDAKAEKRVLIGRKLGAENYVMRLFTLPVGGYTPHHTHDWEHEVFVIKGKIELRGEEGESYTLEEGNFAFVPPNALHGFRNVGDTEAQFICVIPTKGGE